MSKVTGRRWTSAVRVSSAIGPTVCLFSIAVFLLLVCIQMFFSLVLSAGVFILSSRVLISPFRTCLMLEYDDQYCHPVRGAESEIKINILRPVVILGLYVPVVLVTFALLALLLSAYGADRAALRFSAACQAASSLLTLTGIIGFLFLNVAYMAWENMTLSFYMCVCVQVELVITALLTCVSEKKLMSHWK